MYSSPAEALGDSARGKYNRYVFILLLLDNFDNPFLIIPHKEL